MSSQHKYAQSMYNGQSTSPRQTSEIMKHNHYQKVENLQIHVTNVIGHFPGEVS